MSVTQKEIVQTLTLNEHSANWPRELVELANRIEREGIAAPEGYAIVPIESRTGIAIDEGFIPAKYRAKKSL